MFIAQILSRFQLNDDGTSDKQIGKVFADHLTFIEDRDGRLRLDFQSLLAKFDDHCILIHLFKKPITQSVVYLVESRNDLICDLRMLVWKCALVWSTHDNLLVVDSNAETKHRIKYNPRSSACICVPLFFLPNLRIIRRQFAAQLAVFAVA